jgi:nitroreductase
MDLYEAIQKRFSVRSFQSKPVEEDKLRRVLDAGRNSPSARNRQMRRFVVVRDAKARADLARAAEQEWLAQAPVILAVVGLTPDDRMTCQVPTDPVDCAIALDHISLAAVAEGLGTCWIGHFKQDEALAIIGAPATARIIQLMPLGYPAAAQPPRKREPLDKLVCHERMS